MTKIKQYGWNGRWNESFKEYGSLRLKPARVLAEHKNRYRLVTENGECWGEIAGKLHYQANSRKDYPAVGDWVAVAHGENGRVNTDIAVIHAIVERKSLFSRKAAGNTTNEQIVAANFDTVFVMMSLNKDFNLRKLERFIVAAWDSGAVPAILLSKADLCEDVADKVAGVKEIAPGVLVYVVSSWEGAGIDEVKGVFQPGRTVAILGSSGVGKSTFVNTIAGVEILKTGAIREGDDRGRHTTTYRQLILLPDGSMIIDTPGLRELGMIDVSDGVNITFSEIEELAQNCRFRNCSHTNEPDCAVLRAIEEGFLNKDRLEGYRKLQKEAFYMEAKQNQRVMLEQKKRMKQLSNLQKNIYKNGK
jgi:ribosome biogenesis GTPase / thiamine phosphate phosphatase